MKSTAVHKKYKWILDEHRSQSSPLVSPNQSPDLSNVFFAAAPEPVIGSGQEMMIESEMELSDSAIKVFADKDIDVTGLDMTASIDSSRPRAAANDALLRSKTEIEIEEAKNVTLQDETFSRSQTADLSGVNVSKVNNNIEAILDASELYELPFEKMSSIRRGSLDYFKGRVGSFWGQSAIAGKSRIYSIYSRGSRIGGDSDQENKETPRGDDSFLGAMQKVPAREDDSFHV